MNNEAEVNLPLLCNKDRCVGQAGIVLRSGADTAILGEKGIDFSNSY